MSKYITAPLITLLLLAAVACVNLQKLMPDGTVSPEETEYVAAWKAKSRVAELLEAHGWGKPPVDTSGIWIDSARWCIGLAVLSFIFYYATKLHEFGGAGVILGVSAMVCTGVAQVAGWLWLIPAVLVLGGMIYLGVTFRDKSFLNWAKTKTQRRDTDDSQTRAR